MITGCRAWFGCWRRQILTDRHRLHLICAVALIFCGASGQGDRASVPSLIDQNLIGTWSYKGTVNNPALSGPFKMIDDPVDVTIEFAIRRVTERLEVEIHETVVNPRIDCNYSAVVPIIRDGFNITGRSATASGVTASRCRSPRGSSDRREYRVPNGVTLSARVTATTRLHASLTWGEPPLPWTFEAELVKALRWTGPLPDRDAPLPRPETKQLRVLERLSSAELSSRLDELTRILDGAWPDTGILMGEFNPLVLHRFQVDKTRTRDCTLAWSDSQACGFPIANKICTTTYVLPLAPYLDRSPLLAGIDGIGKIAVSKETNGPAHFISIAPDAILTPDRRFTDQVLMIVGDRTIGVPTAQIYFADKGAAFRAAASLDAITDACSAEKSVK